jgi:hypothetical protein
MNKTNFSQAENMFRLVMGVFLALILVAAGTIAVVSARDTVLDLSLTGPLSPGEPVLCKEAADIIFYEGSTVVYSGDDRMQVFGPDGTEQFSARDKNATRMNVPGGRTLPVTRIFNVSSVSIIDPVDSQGLVISDSSRQKTILRIRDETGVAVRPVRLSGAYYLGEGAHVAAVAGDIMVLTPAMKKPANQSVVKFLRHDSGPGKEMGILCTRYAGDITCDGLGFVNGTEEYPDNQALDLFILPAAGEDRPSARVSADAHAIMSSGILYSLVSAVSTPITPQIDVWYSVYPINGAIPVHSPGRKVICEHAPFCFAFGSYIPESSGTYYVRGFVNFTLPHAIVGDDNPQNYYLLPTSAPVNKTAAGQNTGSMKIYRSGEPGTAGPDSSFSITDGLDSGSLATWAETNGVFMREPQETCTGNACGELTATDTLDAVR